MKMEYKVGQKLEHKHTERIAAIVHIYNEYCLVSYEDGAADLFTATDLSILYKPYREPLKTITEVWIRPKRLKHDANELMHSMGFDEWAFEKVTACPTKVRITVEEIEEKS